MQWRQRYNDHLNSEEWRELKREIIDERGAECERCGEEGVLYLHHKTYERLGEELPSDLELLCGDCHKIADEERAIVGRQRSARARYDAAFETYAAKKYGDSWEAWKDIGEVMDEFDEWLERQED
jgi:hypothetical protein